MTDPKSKSRPSLRVPKKKKSLGLSVPPPYVALPHEQLIPSRQVPDPSSKEQNQDTYTSTPSTTSISSTPSTTSISSTPSTTSISKSPRKGATRLVKAAEVAPTRDFQRVPNSVTRQAMPEGIFRGKSKQVWDYLWSVSRGAIIPTRVVRKSRKDIKTGSGLGSMVTVDAAVEHLQSVGLLAVRPAVGSLLGNEYEVFTPDEAILMGTSYTSTSSTSSTTSPTHNLVHLDVLESSISSTTQPVEKSGIYGPPNTFFNTIDDDDGGTSKMCGPIRKMVSEIIGGELPKTDQERERWAECGEVLAAELKRAASRAGDISSVPAFFAEHLRRVFAKATRPQTRQEPRAGIAPQRTPAVVETMDEKLRRMIRELKSIHISDPGYQESDLIEDLKYRCEREEIPWDDSLVDDLIKKTEI